ncbi:unnamed protein product [Mytilus edulis]|uniref:Uncharacterized protein n=1 Tax=Mytilus edulis TaxID=6550 RepID=A0A8S3Q1Y8_MYTED|nr:unnamed protein product [Mytilus edulis]
MHHTEVMVGIEVLVGEAAEAGTKPQDRTAIGKYRTTIGKIKEDMIRYSKILNNNKQLPDSLSSLWTGRSYKDRLQNKNGPFEEFKRQKTCTEGPVLGLSKRNYGPMVRNNIVKSITPSGIFGKPTEAEIFLNGHRLPALLDTGFIRDIPTPAPRLTRKRPTPAKRRQEQKEPTTRNDFSEDTTSDEESNWGYIIREEQGDSDSTIIAKE